MSFTLFKAFIPGNQCRGSHINASFEAMQIYSCVKPPVCIGTVWFRDSLCEILCSGEVDPSLTYFKCEIT